MKLHENKRPGRFGTKAMEVLRSAEPAQPLPFEPEQNITPEQKARMLSHVSPHDQYLLALGLNAFLFPQDEKQEKDAQTYMWQAEKLRGIPLSQENSKDLKFDLQRVMVGEPTAALFPLSLLDTLPNEFKRPIAEKLWDEVKRSHETGFQKRASYALMITIGAEKLLPEKTEEIRAYKEWLKGLISVEKIINKLKFGHERDFPNWELVDLALVAICFPEMQNQIRLDEDFWSNVKNELQMYTDRMESLFATEVDFAATVLAKIPQQKMGGAVPLPERQI